MANVLLMKPVEVDLHGWQENRLRALAREIAMDIMELDDILRVHSVSPVEWDKLANNARFKAMLAGEMQVWGTALNTEERIKLKAQTALEGALLTAQALINDKSEPASARVEMIKTLARISGVTDKVAAPGAVGERFTINIDMGGDKKLTVEHKLPDRVIEGRALEVEDQ